MKCRSLCEHRKGRIRALNQYSLLEIHFRGTSILSLLPCPGHLSCQNEQWHQKYPQPVTDTINQQLIEKVLTVLGRIFMDRYITVIKCGSWRYLSTSGFGIWNNQRKGRTIAPFIRGFLKPPSADWPRVWWTHVHFMSLSTMVMGWCQPESGMIVSSKWDQEFIDNSILCWSSLPVSSMSAVALQTFHLCQGVLMTWQFSWH